MNLFDLLTNRNKTIDYSKNMPPLEAIQLNNDGSVNNNPILADDKPVTAYDKLANRTKQAGNILFNRLFGEQSQPTDYVDTSNDVINAGISDNPRVGGLIPDVMSGFRENASTPFNVNNFGQNKLDNGRDKGFAYRLGEGLGTAGRFLSSELGRGLLTAGAVGLGGGSGLEALAYGTQAGALNNRLRGADQLYRQQLKNNYGYTDEDLQNLRGYVRREDYNTLTNSIYKNNSLMIRQAIAGAQDNTRRANLIMQGLNNGTITPQEAQVEIAKYGITLNDLQKSNATRNADVNEYLAPHKANAYDTGAMVGAGNLVLKQNEAERKAEYEKLKMDVIKELTKDTKENKNNSKSKSEKPKGRAF